MGLTLHEWPLFPLQNGPFSTCLNEYDNLSSNTSAVPKLQKPAQGSLCLFFELWNSPSLAVFVKDLIQVLLPELSKAAPSSPKCPNKINQQPLAGSEGSSSGCLDSGEPSDWWKGQWVKGNLFKVKSPADGLELHTPQFVSLAAVRSFARAIWRD